MMSYHHDTPPYEVWILPPSLDAEPVRIRDKKELKEIFTKHEDTGYEPDLDWLYKSIECEIIDWRNLPGMGHLWFDEEGLLKSDPQVNPLATLLYHTCYDRENVIVGNVVLVVDPTCEDGEAARFVTETIETLKRARTQKAI